MHTNEAIETTREARDKACVLLNAAAAESQRIAAQVPAYVYRDRVWYVRVRVIRS